MSELHFFNTNTNLHLLAQILLHKLVLTRDMINSGCGQAVWISCVDMWIPSFIFLSKQASLLWCYGSIYGTDLRHYCDQVVCRQHLLNTSSNLGVVTFYKWKAAPFPTPSHVVRLTPAQQQSSSSGPQTRTLDGPLLPHLCSSLFKKKTWDRNTYLELTCKVTSVCVCVRACGCLSRARHS